jgi:hypothetical protein
MGSVFQFSALLFIANSIGYFIGAILYARIGGSTGMLLWGVVYGLCLGAGMGAVLHFAQRWTTESS